MKMVKKILLGLSVIAIAVSLTGCLKDDTEGAIKGAGKKWSVDYTNETKVNYRAYKGSGQRHAGGLVKVEFNKDGDPAASKMGVIFGLQETKTEDKKTLRKFNIIGIAADGTYYVSSLDKIEDIQAENFGAKVNAESGATEKEWVKLSAGKKVTMLKDTDENKYAYIWYQAKTDGSYDWAVLSMTDEEAKAYDGETGACPKATTDKGTITGAFDAVASEAKLPQYLISVYAMIQPGKTLSGKWNIVGTYKEAEDAE